MGPEAEDGRNLRLVRKRRHVRERDVLYYRDFVHLIRRIGLR